MQKQDPAYWRVFYTQARAEKKCETRLDQRGIEVFLPTYTAIRRWSDRKKKVVEPLFRNYIFANVDERARLRVLETPGIVRCVSFQGQPAVVSDEEIEQIRIAVKEGGRIQVVDCPRPPVGTRVEVTGGPLRGLKGDVEEHRGQMNVLVCVPSIRQALRVNVPADWVRELQPHRSAA